MRNPPRAWPHQRVREQKLLRAIFSPCKRYPHADGGGDGSGGDGSGGDGGGGGGGGGGER